MYLFDIELPLVLCSVGDFLSDISGCLDEGNLEAMVNCTIAEDGPVRSKWQNCLTGQLTEEERGVSANLLQMWTNFAMTGDPGLGAKLWSNEDPWYSRITDVVEIASDYRDEYHIAADQATTTSTSTTMTTTTTTKLTTSVSPTSETTESSLAMTSSLSIILVSIVSLFTIKA